MSIISSLGTSSAAAADRDDSELCAWRPPPPPLEPTLPQHGEAKCGRRVRSRSSPVRWHAEDTLVVGAEFRARSPSVSPPRSASPGGSIARESKSVGAYFSSRVPTQPVRLVTAARPAPWHVSITDPERSVLQLQNHHCTERLRVVGNVPREVCASPPGGSVVRSPTPPSAFSPSVRNGPPPCLSGHERCVVEGPAYIKSMVSLLRGRNYTTNRSQACDVMSLV
ncbi:hypothetical protein O3G_MSEX012911 [Manduca sexta]|uniref:Uncharacterized protein n=1 Tax=Manduca sexta TaxID=7130 RepID=A0A921ZPT3_MANSE|nr:hypothetical protein O3G_MSEX012911 [Manduca sexta]KAG6461878.1 hypothetical protein O3G_MSEX012911 [Manduca sexta]